MLMSEYAKQFPQVKRECFSVDDLKSEEVKIITKLVTKPKEKVRVIQPLRMSKQRIAVLRSRLELIADYDMIKTACIYSLKRYQEGKGFDYIPSLAEDYFSSGVEKYLKTKVFTQINILCAVYDIPLKVFIAKYTRQAFLDELKKLEAQKREHEKFILSLDDDSEEVKSRLRKTGKEVTSTIDFKIDIQKVIKSFDKTDKLIYRELAAGNQYTLLTSLLGISKQAISKRANKIRKRIKTEVLLS